MAHDPKRVACRGEHDGYGHAGDAVAGEADGGNEIVELAGIDGAAVRELLPGRGAEGWVSFRATGTNRQRPSGASIRSMTARQAMMWASPASAAPGVATGAARRLADHVT